MLICYCAEFVLLCSRPLLNQLKLFFNVSLFEKDLNILIVIMVNLFIYFYVNKNGNIVLKLFITEP